MPRHAEFIVQPNSTFHLGSWHLVFILLAVLSISIAVRFAWLGYWMILPFTIIDISAVGILLYLVVRRSAYVEKILVNEGTVEICHIETNNNRQWQFPLHWTRISLEAPNHRWYPHRLLLGSRGKWVEIGRCLANDERITLAEAIRSEITSLKNVHDPN